MEKLHRVALLEPYSLYGSALKSIIQETNKFEVVCEAAEPELLVELIEKNNPDVLVIDFHNEKEGLESLSYIKKKYNSLPVLVITKNVFVVSKNLKVDGFVSKEISVKELKTAIKKVVKGDTYFGKRLINIMDKSVSYTERKKSMSFIQNELTGRELDVLKLFCGGFSYKEIGNQLYISPRTVETHKKNILSKLNVKSTAEMVRYAVNHNILS